MNDFVGSGHRLTRYDVKHAAAILNCEEAVMRAVLAVESRNSGFDSRRRPIILFEPHVFFRNLRDDKQRQQAIDAGVAYQRWGARPYPKGQDAQYARLEAAIRINEECAYRSISVGIGQILGENFILAGCKSAMEMFKQAKDSESAQLRQMVNFIRNRRLAVYLVNKDWHNFARGYNGSGQVAKYSAWLEREYAKWVKILSKPRAELTAKDLKAAGSKTIKSIDKAKTGLATAGTATIGGTGAVIDELKKQAEPINDAVSMAKGTKDSLDWVLSNWEWFAIVLLILIAAIGFWYVWQGLKTAEDERVNAARENLNMRI